MPRTTQVLSPSQALPGSKLDGGFRTPGGPQASGGLWSRRSDAAVTPLVTPLVPAPSKISPPRGLKQVLEEGGPKAFAKAVRERRGLLLTDTTWRDAHQSLLATRVRTRALLAIAPATALGAARSLGPRQHGRWS